MQKAILDLKSCQEIISSQDLGIKIICVLDGIIILATWIYFKVSYKDTRKKRRPLGINLPTLKTKIFGVIKFSVENLTESL